MIITPVFPPSSILPPASSSCCLAYTSLPLANPYHHHRLYPHRIKRACTPIQAICQNLPTSYFTQKCRPHQSLPPHTTTTVFRTASLAMPVLLPALLHFQTFTSQSRISHSSIANYPLSNPKVCFSLHVISLRHLSDFPHRHSQMGHDFTTWPFPRDCFWSQRSCFP